MWDLRVQYSYHRLDLPSLYVHSGTRLESQRLHWGMYDPEKPARFILYNMGGHISATVPVHC